MFRKLYGFVWLAVIGIHVSAAFAQVPSSNATAQLCDETCQRQKLDALFKALDEAQTSQRSRPSNSADCSAYAGRDLPDTFLDVCAKLKYVRSRPPGETSRFSCPSDSTSLIGISGLRVISTWGEPDFVHDSSSPGRAKNDGLWTYFLGSTKPGRVGGGFAELTLYLADGVVRKVDCGLGQ